MEKRFSKTKKKNLEVKEFSKMNEQTYHLDCAKKNL